MRARRRRVAHDVSMTSTIRPMLAPGTRVFRLGADTALIGANPGTVVRLKPGTLELLRLLNGVRDLDLLQHLITRIEPDFHGRVSDVLFPLIQAGAVLPGRPSKFRISTPTFDTDGAGEPFTSKLQAAFESPAPSESEPWRIVVTTGEPARSAFDSFLYANTPHVPIVLDETFVHLGPLVVPTQTPCLRCYDAARTRLEPRWHAMSSQFGTSTLECAVPLSAQYQAIAVLMRALENDGGESLLGARISVSTSTSPRVTRFGFGLACHCNLLAA